MLVFSTQLCEILPLKPFLVHPPPPPSQSQSTVYTDSVWLRGGGGGGGGVLSWVGDHVLQESNTLFLTTRFRTYKISTPPQTKN
jgi:hypothetical protein